MSFELVSLNQQEKAPIVVLRQTQPHPYMHRTMKSMLTWTLTLAKTPATKALKVYPKPPGSLRMRTKTIFKDQEDDLIGPVDKTTQSHHLSSLATLGFRLKNTASLTFSPCKVISQPAIPSPINPSQAHHFNATLICNSKPTATSQSFNLNIDRRRGQTKMHYVETCANR